MNRLRVRVFSAVAALAVVLAALLPVSAQENGAPNFWFAGTKLIFERAIPLDGDVAVSIRDSGLLRFLARLGATIAYQPRQRYVVVTAADHRTITFTIGSAQYSAGGVSARASFAPMIDGNEPILPLYALAHALYVEPVAGAAPATGPPGRVSTTAAVSASATASAAATMPSARREEPGPKARLPPRPVGCESATIAAACYCSPAGLLNTSRPNGARPGCAA